MIQFTSKPRLWCIITPLRQPSPIGNCEVFIKFLWCWLIILICNNVLRVLRLVCGDIFISKRDVYHNKLFNIGMCGRVTTLCNNGSVYIYQLTFEIRIDYFLQ